MCSLSSFLPLASVNVAIFLMKSVSDAPGIVHYVMALTAVTGWSDARGLSDVDRVRMIRFQTQTLFDDYVSDRQYDMRGRFGELLLLLPSLQTISVQLINQLHAAKQCGLITVDSLLQEMLLGGTAHLGQIIGQRSLGSPKGN